MRRPVKTVEVSQLPVKITVIVPKHLRHDLSYNVITATLTTPITLVLSIGGMLKCWKWCHARMSMKCHAKY